jgi:DNA mismatch repair protein MutS
MPHDMIDEYFDIYKKSINEYGERTCVLYACGSFYEVYEVDNVKEKIGNASVIAEIIRCDFSNKNKQKRSEEGSTRAFPDFCGFGVAYLPKYLNPLLENNYTVVIVDQLESSSEKKNKLVKRGIVAVHSPCLKSPDLETYDDTETYLLGITLEFVLSKTQSYKNEILIYSVCAVNNTTNTIDITENILQLKRNEFRSNLDDLGKILSRYNCKEIKINIIDYENNSVSFLTSIEKFFREKSIMENYIYKTQIINKSDNIYKQYNKKIYQNEYFKQIYKHIDFGLIEPVEYLGLNEKEVSRINFMYLLDFMSKHDLRYISNLSVPNIIKDDCNLSLELNTISQLNILPNKSIIDKRISSVFDVINYTSTSIGRRHLKSILSKPFRDPYIIKFRYDLTDEFSKLDDTNISEINNILSKIIDFDRLHRKMGLDSLHPFEFEKLHNSYINITALFKIVNSNAFLMKTLPSEVILEKMEKYIEDYKLCFNLDIMRKISLNTSIEDFLNFFNKNIIVELDKIDNDIKKLEENIEEIRVRFENIINEKRDKSQAIKLGFTDNDGYFFTCTKIRYQKLIKECKDISFNMKQTSNTCKFTTEDLTQKSNLLIKTRELLSKRVKTVYIQKLQDYYKNYNDVFQSLTKFIELIDVSLSNMKCSIKNKYCKPNCVFYNESYIKCTKLRHPIIEIINDDTEYIPNDINLSNETLGMLVYGLNSSGKSSLLRSLGVAIVLAQCGLYVPANNFEYSPFHTLISQVDLTDNLFANKSSFTSEMCGLKKILECSSQNTLVLSDELCRGTEVNSSSAMVATTLHYLLQSNTKFFFTTHLHDLCKIDIISNDSRINICHLSVETRDDVIIFERILKPGSGSDLYGLEVCKSIIQNESFINLAFSIRNKITNNKMGILESKGSRYNKKKILDKCQVCGYKPKRGEIPLDTHHINEQKNCDELGFVNDKHFHKNKMFNLVVLCKDCHQNIDTGKLTIRGYKSSTSGIFLDYTKEEFDTKL